MELYTKTLFSRIAIEIGTNYSNTLVDMKIKVPVEIAKAIIECTHCIAEPGDIETMFDILCKNIFTKGIQAASLELLKDDDEFTKKMITIEPCKSCLLKIMKGKTFGNHI